MIIIKQIETEKDVFMRARSGNIKISFSNEEEAKKWEERIVSSLKEKGLNVMKK